MAEAMNPMDRKTTSAAGPSTEAEAIAFAPDRPGLVTFAAVMAFIVAGFQVTWALIEFFNAAWITGTTYGNFGGYLWLWAILDLVIAGFTAYAGYDILRGGSFGYIYGVIVAAFSAVRWFFYLPAAPWLGIVVIAVDILIIYGLVSNMDYFRAHATA